MGGEEREVFKDPVTDSGKRSKRGRLVLVRTGEAGGVETVREQERGGTGEQGGKWCSLRQGECGLVCAG